MTLTYIHCVTNLFDDAGGFARPARLPSSDRKVFLRTASTSNEQCQIFMGLLRSVHFDKWVWTDENKHGEPSYHIGHRPGSLEFPEMRVSNVFNRYKVPENLQGGFPYRLAYMLVIQGADAALTTKVTLCYDMRQAWEALMCEGLNGYSMVFGAAILQEAANALLDVRRNDVRKPPPKMIFHRVPIGQMPDRASGTETEPAWAKSLLALTNVKPDMNEMSIAYLH